MYIVFLLLVIIFLTLGLWIFCIISSTMDIFFNGTDDQL